MSENSAGFGVLSQAECLRLLDSAKVGRVVYTEHALPSITPVNFALDGSAVVFRTSRGSRLARATDDVLVAFQVDRVDEDAKCGWSVVVTGVAATVHTASDLLRVEQFGLVSWAGGDRSHYVRIMPGIITGRRVAAAHSEPRN